jgi:hypothetical protein
MGVLSQPSGNLHGGEMMNHLQWAQHATVGWGGVIDQDKGPCVQTASVKTPSADTRHSHSLH